MNEGKKDTEQFELEKIRRKKMLAMMDAQKKQDETQKKVLTVWDKVDYVLRVVLHPDAYSYLNKIKENELPIYQAIISELVNPSVISNINYLITIIQRRGGAVPRRIPLDIIVFLERKAKGIKSKIQVKQGSDGEMMDLSSYLAKGPSDKS